MADAEFILNTAEGHARPAVLFTMVGVIVHQAVCPIQLFGKQYTHKTVWQGERR
jgi:hypothetical protein